MRPGWNRPPMWKLCAQLVGAHGSRGLRVDGDSGTCSRCGFRSFRSCLSRSSRLSAACRCRRRYSACWPLQPRRGSAAGWRDRCARMASRAASRIAGRNGVQDHQMLALQPCLVFARQHAVGAPGRGDVAGDGARRRARRAPRHRTDCWSPTAMARWKAKSVLPVASPSASSRSNSKNASWICGLLRAVAAQRRERRRFRSRCPCALRAR